MSEATTDSQRLEALERLSTRELHDRAVRRAKHHLDVRFFWSLLQTIPEAEAISGNPNEADFDMTAASALIADTLHSGNDKLADALRPLFIDYLQKHPDA